MELIALQPERSSRDWPRKSKFILVFKMWFIWFEIFLCKFNLHRLLIQYSSWININYFSELFQTSEKLFSICSESGKLWFTVFSCTYTISMKNFSIYTISANIFFLCCKSNKWILSSVWASPLLPSVPLNSEHYCPQTCFSELLSFFTSLNLLNKAAPVWKKNQIGAPIPATNNCSEEKESPDTQQHAGV